MEAYVEPTYHITDLTAYDDGKDPCHIISMIKEDSAGLSISLSDPELQDWDFTPMLQWCIENFNGKYKIVMTEYNDFYIEVYDQNDAFAFKMRWA